jgi:hypothetical protein
MTHRPDRTQHLAPLAFVLIMLAGLSGCQTSVTTGPSESTASTQGVNVKVIHPNTTTSTQTKAEGSDDRQYWQFLNSWAGQRPGRVEVVIENLHLQVDGKDYGTLQAGDNLTVDVMNGCKVSVNDQPRSQESNK